MLGVMDNVYRYCAESIQIDKPICRSGAWYHMVGSLSMYIAMAYFHASQQIANIGEIKRVTKQKRFLFLIYQMLVLLKYNITNK